MDEFCYQAFLPTKNPEAYFHVRYSTKNPEA